MNETQKGMPGYETTSIQSSTRRSKAALKLELAPHSSLHKSLNMPGGQRNILSASRVLELIHKKHSKPSLTKTMEEDGYQVPSVDLSIHVSLLDQVLCRSNAK